MKQDVRINCWVLISAIFQVLASAVCIITGVLIAIMGIASSSKLLKIRELKFFVSQNGIIKLQQNLFGGLILKKYLFLIMGTIIAIVGIVAVTFAIVEILYVRRYKIVNHQCALIAFSLIPLIIAGCAEIYLLVEYDILRMSLDYIKNVRTVSFVVCVVFSLCAVLKLLGVLFIKSEEFVSNDNNKYAFESPKLDKVAHNVVGKQPLVRNQPRTQVESSRIIDPSSNLYVTGQRKLANVQTRSSTNMTSKVAMPKQNVNIKNTNIANAGARIQTVRPLSRPGTAQMPRSATLLSRPVQNSISPRQMGIPSSQMGRIRPTQIRRCPQCGKTLMPNETMCGICGKAANK